MIESSSPTASGCGLCTQPATLQCLICLKRGLRPAPTFCGAHCYREHWKTHRSQQEGGPSGSSSPDLSTKSSISSTSSVASSPTTHSSRSASHSPSSVLSQSPTRPAPVHRRHRSHLNSHPTPQNPSRESHRESPIGPNWGQHWPGATSTCHPPQWYDHAGWPAHPGMHHLHRGMPQEQVVGATTGWGTYHPARYGPPHQYWGNF